MSILLTGGLGFIGSHTAVELLNDGYEIIIVDNLSNSSIDVRDKIKTITKKDFEFYDLDINDYHDLHQVFDNHNIETVIHFAAFKALNESISEPLKYYHNNISGLITLLRVMENHGVQNIIYSSSATVYGNPTSLPLSERSPLSTINPYGTTKLMGEMILSDMKNMNVTILRYFNPVGAHKSGLIGERPVGIPNNLFPYILDVVSGKRQCLKIFGNDYDTLDGTPVRDYIHVSDLSKGHVKALESIKGVKIYNLGTGKGYSVLEIVNAFNDILTNPIAYELVDRREGDSPAVYADSSLANKELNWTCEYGLNEMITDSLNFIGRS